MGRSLPFRAPPCRLRGPLVWRRWEDKGRLEGCVWGARPFDRLRVSGCGFPSAREWEEEGGKDPHHVMGYNWGCLDDI